MKIKNKKGFSIAETLIAVFILVVGLVSLIFLTANSMKNSMDSRDQIIAGALAQEGVELVRNIRDTNLASGASNIFQNIPDTSTGCIDYSNSSVSSCGYQLYLSGSNFYLHSSSGTIPTKFFRKIIISTLDANTKSITSYVSWNGSAPDTTKCNAANKCVSVQDTLVNTGI